MLGPMQVALDGAPVADFATDKVRVLLAFLAVESDRPHRREFLAGLLWPEQPESAARTSLRRVLADLRAAIGDRRSEPPFLLTTRQSIQLNPSADVWVDVRELLEAQEDETPVPRLEESVGLYQGDFLEGFFIPDGEAIEEWAVLERERLRRHLLRVLRRLADHYQQAGDLERALEFARRRVEADRWSEEAHRRVMSLLALTGERSAAVSQYESMSRILEEDLGIEPEDASNRLLEQIRSGRLRPPDGTRDPEREPRVVGSCPYRGLASFREVDAQFFYGREGFVDRLVEAVQSRPIVAVIVGSSGSGKSSTVFAGLLPRLRDDPGWKVISLRPGVEPFHALANAVLPKLEPAMSETTRLIESRKMADALRAGEILLEDVVDRVLGTNEQAHHMLLLVDQCEELYTLCPDPKLQRRFLDVLLTTAAGSQVQGPSQAVLLITLRADFMGRALEYRPFADALQDASLMLGPMNGEELLQAIERPAESQGAAFEPGLVDRLLDDVGDEPGNLPLLEFALTLLWEQQSSGWMTHSGYEAIGRVQGALARYAEKVYEDLDDTDKTLAKLIFKQLVRPGEGTDDTRRVATRAELGDDSWALVASLADRRLVVTGRDATGQDIVEVVHEALIQRWDRLRAWIDADRTFRIWQEDLRAGVRAWKASGHDEEALLRGASLAEAERWQSDRSGELSADETDFIEASIVLRERLRVSGERRRRRTILALGSGLIVSMVLALAALQARSSAQREAEVNRSLVLTAAAEETFRRGDTNLALALALEAVDMEQPPAEALADLAAIAFGPGTRAVLEGHSNEVRSAALSAGGRWAFSGSCGDLGTDGICTKGELILWDLESSTESARIEGHSGWVNDLAFGPDDTTAISASEDSTLILWEVSTGEVVREFRGHDAGVNCVALSPDGSSAVSGSDDGRVIVWDVASADIVRRLEGHNGGITSVAFDPSGERVLSASQDSTMILWQVSSGELLTRFEGHTDTVTDAVFHSDENRVISLSRDVTLRVWDLDSGAEIQRVDFSAEPSRLAITPDGETVFATVKTDLNRFDARSLQNEGFMIGHRLSPTATGDINHLSISADGRLALSAGTDGTLRVWNLELQGIRQFPTDGQSLNAVAVNDNGSLLLTATGPGEVTLWDVPEGEVIRRFGAGALAPHCLVFGPGTYQIALACDADLGADPEESWFVLWDLTTGEEIRRFQGHVAGMRALAFLPDGRSALAGSQGYPDYSVGDLILWDLESGQIIRHFDLDHDVTHITISADGSQALTSSATDLVAILWDVATGRQVRRFEGPSPLLNVAFGPREFTVLAASWDGSVVVWDIETGEILRSYKGHEAPVWGLDVSRDGRFVVSGSEDGVVILWDYETGQELRRADAHTGAAIDVAFHPDSRSVFSIGWDGALIEWQNLDPSLEELLEWIETNRYVRELTCEEAESYGVEIAECG
jgi:WD40 repeat protein